MVPPLGISAVWLMLPVPLAVPVAPPVYTAVQVPVTPAGKVLVMVEPGALLGPLLVTTKV